MCVTGCHTYCKYVCARAVVLGDGQVGFSGDVAQLTWTNLAYQPYFSATAAKCVNACLRVGGVGGVVEVTFARCVWSPWGGRGEGGQSQGCALFLQGGWVAGAPLRRPRLRTPCRRPCPFAASPTASGATTSRAPPTTWRCTPGGSRSAPSPALCAPMTVVRALCMVCVRLPVRPVRASAPAALPRPLAPTPTTVPRRHTHVRARTLSPQDSPYPLTPPPTHTHTHTHTASTHRIPPLPHPCISPAPSSLTSCVCLASRSLWVSVAVGRRGVVCSRL
jgi:hypothetical protein